MSTPSKLPCRLIDHGPAPGAWQMAVDEALLESAATGRRMSLRFYGWAEPTLSLGYFQPHAQRVVHAASRQCPLVRRQSGGGAIVHDRELTYSLAVPAAHPLAGDPDSLYRLVHDALVRTLADFGLRAERYEGRHGMPEEQAFLCFQRRAIGDVLVGDAKVCGSAQRRRRGAILQHGSLLLAHSERAPELPGVCELSERPIDQADLRSAWREELTGQHGTTWEPGELVPAEIAAASLLFREKYTTDGWNHRR